MSGGGWFKTPGEQRAIFDLLSSAETQHGWPTSFVVNLLVGEWDLQ